MLLGAIAEAKEEALMTPVFDTRGFLQFCRLLQGLCRPFSPTAARVFARFAAFGVFLLLTCAHARAHQSHFFTPSHVYRYVVQNCKTAKVVLPLGLASISEAAKPAKCCKNPQVTV